jgi:HEPN domain-containing protein
MGADDARAQDVRAWLQKAALDLRAGAHGMSAGEAGLRSDVVFHAQQAAEKALKGFLAWHDVPFRKTHSLEELGCTCVSLDGTLRTIVDRAAPLTEYAWKFRYPGEPSEPSRGEAEHALRTARQVFEAVASRLPKDVRPSATSTRTR